jgi:hypothetical protein
MRQKGSYAKPCTPLTLVSTLLSLTYLAKQGRVHFEDFMKVMESDVGLRLQEPKEY